MALKRWFPLVAVVLIFAACTPIESHPNVGALPAGSETPSLDHPIPVTGDDPLKRAEVKIDSLAILVSDTFPPQYQLAVKGSLPTSCHNLRTEVEMPKVNSEIHVQIFSDYDPYAVCAQVSKPFETTIPLGGYVRGSYTVFVNEKEIGEITP